MNCPNCGLSNPDTAKFCANCGTAFNSVPPAQSPPVYQAQPYQQPASQPTGNKFLKGIGLGCLIAIVIVLLFGLSCTRACYRYGHRRAYIHRRY
jgi:uncharacterized membrane protein YvbJ